MGLIMGLLIPAMFNKSKITLFCDSMLVVNQVRGNNVVRNVRFVYLVPIVHDLILHYNHVDLSYIPRENNVRADQYAKQGCDGYGATDANPDIFKIIKRGN